jgi:hypothetical protein
MGGPSDPSVDARLRALEAQQKAASQQQAKLQAELAKQQARFEKTLDILQDYSDAIIFLQKYLMHFALESVEHAMMISSAIAKFAAFLKLPPSSSSINRYLDFAFTAVAALFPAIRLMKLLDDVSQEANVALAIAKASETAPPRLATVVAKGVPKAAETTDVLKKANDTRMKALAALKSDASSGAVGELSKLDSSKGAIRYFVETATSAAKTFDTVADVIDAEFKLRVRDPDISRKETILDKTTKILVTPNFLTPPELDQLEASYILEMLKSYCSKKENVVFVKQIGWGAEPGAEIRGLNETQLEAIIDLLGPNVPRGRYFFQPPFPFPGYYLYAWGTQTIVEDTGRMPPR